MTPEHAAEQLLALGALAAPEFAQITGWPELKIRRTIRNLQQAGRVIVTPDGCQRDWRYWHADHFPRHLYERSPDTDGLRRRRWFASRG